ncbi:YfbM family protein [Dulcicalothrix desertica]|uniref:YfbM family protein n=1 Tax=Dulcicalothrix desertica TaxID=32056 RepID=UPI000F8EA817|nr:YfbM family protein [Dulcicalothrix desertica]
MGSLLTSKHNQDDDINYLYLDKTWHGLHFLLTGDLIGSEPLSWVIFGNHSVGGDENQLLYGYSWIGLRYLLPDEVARVSEVLSSITVEKLRANFLSQAMDEALIYPIGIWVRDGEDALNWLLMFYDGLVKFYQHAASGKKAIIMYVD